MDQKKLSCPSKEKIRDTLMNCGKSFRKITEEIPMCRTSLMNIIDLKNYSFQNYEKIIAYCRTLAPEENWSYPSLEELTVFYKNNTIPRKEGVSSSLRSSFLSHGTRIPKVDNYLLLCNIKFKMEAENQCLE